MGARIGSRLTLDQGAKLGVGANARNAANSADGHRSYALADTESDSHKEETISKTSASLHVGWIRVGCFLLWSVLCGNGTRAVLSHGESVWDDTRNMEGRAKLPLFTTVNSLYYVSFYASARV